MGTALRIAVCFAALLPLGASSQTLEMQVEEPSPATPPIDPERETGNWQGKSAGQALSKAQKAAYEERGKQVVEMASEVRAKREALANATAETRAARVKELQRLILDPAEGAALGVGKRERLEKGLEKQAEAKAEAREKKLDRLESQKEKSRGKRREKLDKHTDSPDRKEKPGK